MLLPTTSAMSKVDSPGTAALARPAIAAGLREIEGVETLHARTIPGTRASIDHIVIGPSGVYVIDTHDHAGPVVRRDRRLFVCSQDRTDLVAAMRIPVDAVASALGDLHFPISRALCFVGGEWSLSAPPFMLKGVWVGLANPLFRLVAQPGRLQAREIEAAARVLDEHLPAAC